MKVYQEISLKNFEFWGGARYTRKWLTDEQLNYLEYIIEELYDGEPIYEYHLNDLFWFQDDLIAEWLGAPSFQDIRYMNEKNGHVPDPRFED